MDEFILDEIKSEHFGSPEDVKERFRLRSAMWIFITSLFVIIIGFSIWLEQLSDGVFFAIIFTSFIPGIISLALAALLAIIPHRNTEYRHRFSRMFLWSMCCVNGIFVLLGLALIVYSIWIN